MKPRARGDEDARRRCRASSSRRVGAHALLTACKFIALRIFALGFLLARVESSARAVSAPTTAPIVEKIVVFVIDGARYDWTTVERRGEDGDGAARRRLQLPSARRYGSACDAKTGGARGRGEVFKFIADAPTTTQQRLKGLLTGGLPTFIDASASFGGTSLGEDNVIEQLRARGRRMTISGDDTWAELFDVNATFTSGAHMYPSFDVKDTETVDAGVRKSMADALARPNDWDVLIGHMLGADHVGHTHGATTDYMRDKLAENDLDIERVVETMRADERYADAMLFVFGDHGMTDNGDHGGGTPEEVESFLLAYHPWATNGLECERKRDDEFPQLDFASTMAALLGVPIPHGNLGTVNEKVFTLAHGKGKTKEVYASYVRALHVNAEQIWTYLNTYREGKAHPFGKENAERLERLLNIARANKSLDTTKFVLEFMRDVASVARAQWAQFGLLKMAVGFVALIATLVAHAYIAFDDVNGPASMASDAVGMVGVAMVILASVSRLSNSFIVQEREMMQFLFATFVVAASVKAFANDDVKATARGGQCLLANVLLYFIGAFWVKSDSTDVPRLALAPTVVVALAVAAAAVRAIHETCASKYNGKLRALDVALFGWIAVTIRSVLILTFIDEDVWLARVVYASGVAAVALNGLDDSNTSSSRSSNVKRGAAMFLIAIAPIVAMLAGPIMGVLYVGATYFLYDGLRGLLLGDDADSRARCSETALGAGLWLASVVVFFGGGHACSFDGLHFASAFTGFREFRFYVMGFLLGFETWSGDVLLAAAVPLFAAFTARKNTLEEFKRVASRLSLKIAFFRAVAVASATLCAALHRRHLMVWAIFAPKFVFDAVGSSVADITALLLLLIAFRSVDARRTKRE